MMALTEKRNEKVQVCETILVRIIAGSKRELIRDEWMN